MTKITPPLIFRNEITEITVNKEGIRELFRTTIRNNKKVTLHLFLYRDVYKVTQHANFITVHYKLTNKGCIFEYCVTLDTSKLLSPNNKLSTNDVLKFINAQRQKFQFPSVSLSTTNKKLFTTAVVAAAIGTGTYLVHKHMNKSKKKKAKRSSSTNSTRKHSPSKSNSTKKKHFNKR